MTQIWRNIMKYSWGTTFENTMDKRKYGSDEEVLRKEIEKAVSSFLIKILFFGCIIT